VLAGRGEVFWRRDNKINKNRSGITIALKKSGYLPKQKGDQD
jgi:hypothetical protein